MTSNGLDQDVHVMIHNVKNKKAHAEYAEEGIRKMVPNRYELIVMIHHYSRKETWMVKVYSGSSGYWKTLR